MKRLSLVVLVVSLLIMTNSTFGESIKWIGGDGNFNDPCMWDMKVVPTNALGEEVKVSAYGTCTINTNVGDFPDCKSAISDGSTILLADGGWIGIKEHKIGDSGAGGEDDGYQVQTGGTITTSVGGKIIVGYKALGVGGYTISGGNLGVSGDGLRLYVGCGASAAGADGTFTVDGEGGTITVDDLWVGSRDTGGGNPGTGTIEFKLGSGVSPINVTDSINIDVTDIEEAVAILALDMSEATSAPPEDDITLIAGTVTGEFDTIHDSNPGDVAGGEGAPVVLIYDGLWYYYNLTYAGSVELVYSHTVPEPATVALFGLGLIAVVRRRR